RLLAASSDGGRPYLVFPLVPGGSLRDRLAKGALGIEETVGLGVALARALGRAHAAGIIHRDLKPENVLFADPGTGAAAGGSRPLIADLGLAKHFASDSSRIGQSAALTSGGLLGTAGYMSPEQV